MRDTFKISKLEKKIIKKNKKYDLLTKRAFKAIKEKKDVEAKKIKLEREVSAVIDRMQEEEPKSLDLNKVNTKLEEK